MTIMKNNTSLSDTIVTQPRTSQNVFTTLIPELERAVKKQGYATPTPIQEQCIPVLLEGRDLVGTAQTGTGKTAAFVLPILQQLADFPRQTRKATPRALILAPTRELAAQIGESIQGYGHFLNLRHTVIFGGVSQFHQVKALNRGVDILVATPGRLLDLKQQGLLHLGAIKFFVLDEVDRMLDMGFIHDIKKVLDHIPSERQTLFFSATMPPKMEELAYTMVKNPARVTIEPDQPAVDRIEQKVFFVEKRDKEALLVSLLKKSDIDKVIIFTQMKHVANRLVKKLNNKGIQGSAIHGNKSQAARTKTLKGFKEGLFPVLVATDVAARGLDVDDITHVINYDLPIEAETYVHRIGRTARAGADGDAISFCCAEDRSNLRDIERLLKKPIPVETNHVFHSEEISKSSVATAKKQRNNRRDNGAHRPRQKSQRRNRSRRQTQKT